MIQNGARANLRFQVLVGVGGIGTGMFFALDGDRTLGRNESRLGRLLDYRDYCKLHIITHFACLPPGVRPSGKPFHALPIGKVGDDEAGWQLLAEMGAAGMDTRFVDVVAGKPTMLSVCFQYPDGSGGNITTNNAAPGELTAADIDRAALFLKRHGARAIALAAPEVPLKLRKHLLALATKHGAFRAASFASGEMAAARKHGLFRQIDLLAINEDEAATLAGVAYNPKQPQRMLGACAAMLTRANPRMQIVVSAGKHGAHAFDGGRWGHAPAIPVTVASTAGAGDALFGGVLAGLAAGLPLLGGALDLGVLLATINVTSPHTIHPARRREIPTVAKRLGVSLNKSLRDLFLVS